MIYFIILQSVAVIHIHPHIQAHTLAWGGDNISPPLMSQIPMYNKRLTGESWVSSQ